MFDNLPNISRANEKRQNMLKTSCCLVERSSMEAPSGVIGHGIGGKHIPAKMARLAES